MLGHKRVPSREGGIEIVVEELASRFAAQGHHVTCYNRAGHHVSGAEFDVDAGTQYRGIRLKTAPCLDKRGLAAITASFTAAWAAAFGKYDVVHFHAEGPAFMCWLPRLTGKRVVVTIHGLDHRRAKWGRLARTYIMLGERNAVRFAHSIIVLSADVQAYFLETYGRETVLIPNGANRQEKRAPEQIVSRFGLQKDGYILFLGRLVPEKGIHYLIEAFRQVNTDKKLVIAGGTSDSDQYAARLHRLAEGDDRVCFTGFVHGQVLEELYTNCYVYCLPSDLEGMPLSLLEAMGYGSCCLVSDIPECRDVVEDHAVTFRKGDIADLAQKLQQLCDHPETVRFHQSRAADFITEKYSWDDVARRTLALYRMPAASRSNKDL